MVTAPFLANALPFNTAPVLKVMDSKAITFPLKEVVVPNDAEPPTCQKILEAFAPPAKNTFRPGVVVSVDAICMINTASAFPSASNVTSPEEIDKEEVDL